MAKASWVKVDPSTGSGNKTVNVSSTTHNTGRNARTTTLTWQAANVEPVTRNVAQAGKPSFVDIDDAAAADKVGKIVTIGGVSNARMLRFSLGSGNLDIKLPTVYIANSVSVSLDPLTAVPGDPGATAEFSFSITIEVPANTTFQPKTRQIIVTTEDGKEDICVLTSAADTAYITIQEGTIELDYLGTPVPWTVESNTSWTIE